jgi:hypothetical protein
MDTKTTGDTAAESASSLSRLQLAEQWWATFTAPQKSQVCRCIVGNLPRTMQASPTRHKNFLARLFRNGIDPATLVKAKPKAATLISQHLPALIADDQHATPDDTFISEVLSSVCESDKDLGKAYISIMISTLHRKIRTDRKESGGAAHGNDTSNQADNDESAHPNAKDDPFYWGRRTVEKLINRPDIFFNLSENFAHEGGVPIHEDITVFVQMTNLSNNITSPEYTRRAIEMIHALYPLHPWAVAAWQALVNNESILSMNPYDSDGTAKLILPDPCATQHDALLADATRNAILLILAISEGLFTEANAFLTPEEATRFIDSAITKPDKETGSYIAGALWACAREHRILPLIPKTKSDRNSFWDGFRHVTARDYESGSPLRMERALNRLLKTHEAVGLFALREQPASRVHAVLQQLATTRQWPAMLEICLELQPGIHQETAERVIHAGGPHPELRAQLAVMLGGPEFYRSAWWLLLACQRLDDLRQWHKTCPESADNPALQIAVYLARYKGRPLNDTDLLSPQLGMDQQDLRAAIWQDGRHRRSVYEAAMDLVAEHTGESTTASIDPDPFVIQAIRLLLIAGEPPATGESMDAMILRAETTTEALALTYSARALSVATAKYWSTHWASLEDTHIIRLLSMTGPGANIVWEAFKQRVLSGPSLERTLWQSPPETWVPHLRIILDRCHTSPADQDDTVEFLQCGLAAWPLAAPGLWPIVAEHTLLDGAQHNSGTRHKTSPPQGVSDWIDQWSHTDDGGIDPRLSDWLAAHPIADWLESRYGSADMARIMAQSALNAGQPEMAETWLCRALGQHGSVGDLTSLCDWARARQLPERSVVAIQRQIDERLSDASGDDEEQPDADTLSTLQRRLANGETVKILFIGGNEEIQGQYDERLTRLFAELYPGLVLSTWHTGWTSNWGRFTKQLIEMANANDAVVLHSFMRTLLGRTVREALTVPWRSCHGTGMKSMERSIEQAAMAALRERD